MASQDIINRFNSLIPQLSGPKIVEMMRQHGVKISELTALDAHPDKKAYVEGVMLKEEEERAWNQIEPLTVTGNLANMPIIQNFIDQWQAYDFAAQHVKRAKDSIADIWRAQEEQDWQNIQPQISTPSTYAMSLLKQFIDKWSQRSGLHVFEAQQRLSQIQSMLEGQLREQEQREWDSLQFSNNIPDMISHINKWQSQGIETHGQGAEERAWNMVQGAPDKMSAVRQYLTYFPTGSHAMQAREALDNYDVWMNIKGSRDLVAVGRFINEFPQSFFIDEARVFKNQLKIEEIEKMKREQDQYSGDYMLQLITEGIFTDNELYGHGVATPKSLEILRNLMEIKGMLPSLQEVQAHCQTHCEPGRTDVYLFGTPATGKTCILMGLIGSPKLSTNMVKSAGEYAAALDLYLRHGFTPGQTVKGFVATIQATVHEKTASHDINLVELAGEDFAINIATARDGMVDFAQMGEGVPQLLSNNNRKVFFLIVDPTSRTLLVRRTEPMYDNNGNQVFDEYGQPRTETKIYPVDQRQSLKKMIDMLKDPVNKKIMDKVDAVHVILTKGDKLGNDIERENQAYRLFMDNYYSYIQPDLTLLCRKHGINQHPKKELNGVPRLFTFSLGQFYPGGIYEYDSVDANTLVNTISRCTQGIRPQTLWDRFCEAMNRPLI